ncbi:hypothetical protein [Rhodococcoides fascians]|uniref:hypothetical protein n=1 Tax=Rhodococcoides fascians TaxID=1828 RepID=UPI000B268742|nr:hypothetical protein [Rhodococcus fascians]
MSREIAEMIADLPESNEPPTPLGYTLDTYLLLTIVDSLQSVQAAVIAAAGADPPQLTPMKRPQTALDIVKDERWRGRMQNLIDLFSAHGNAEGDN